MVVVKERGADTIKMAYGTAWLEMATYLKLQASSSNLRLGSGLSTCRAQGKERLGSPFFSSNLCITRAKTGNKNFVYYQAYGRNSSRISLLPFLPPRRNLQFEIRIMDKRLEDFHSLREATSHRKLHRCAVVAIRLFDRRCSELKELNRSICSIQTIFRLTRPVKWCLFQAIFVIRDSGLLRVQGRSGGSRRPGTLQQRSCNCRLRHEYLRL